MKRNGALEDCANTRLHLVAGREGVLSSLQLDGCGASNLLFYFFIFLFFYFFLVAITSLCVFALKTHASGTGNTTTINTTGISGEHLEVVVVFSYRHSYF